MRWFERVTCKDDVDSVKLCIEMVVEGTGQMEFRGRLAGMMSKRTCKFKPAQLDVDGCKWRRKVKGQPGAHVVIRRGGCSLIITHTENVH